MTQGALGAVFYDGLEQIEIQGIERSKKIPQALGIHLMVRLQSDYKRRFTC